MPDGDRLNTLVLDGEPTEVGALRRTPAGVAILEFRVAHLSRQIEGGLEREVRSAVPICRSSTCAATSTAASPSWMPASMTPSYWPPPGSKRLGLQARITTLLPPNRACPPMARGRSASSVVWTMTSY